MFYSTILTSPEPVYRYQTQIPVHLVFNCFLLPHVLSICTAILALKSGSPLTLSNHFRFTTITPSLAFWFPIAVHSQVNYSLFNYCSFYHYPFLREYPTKFHPIHDSFRTLLINSVSSRHTHPTSSPSCWCPTETL